MINVSSWSIRNPIAASMVFVLLTVAGLLSYNSMKVPKTPKPLRLFLTIV